MWGSRGGTRGSVIDLPLGAVAVILALAVTALGACGGDDDDEGEGEASASELTSSLPTADELGLDERAESESDDATGVFVGEDSLIIGGATNPSDIGAAIDEAGFQSAVGSALEGKDLNVRIHALQFDSEEGALEARDVLHEEDLKSPCVEACVVTPSEYELAEVPDSAAVHHVPSGGDLPRGMSPVEAHHAEFVIGPQLYVVQVDGKPSPTFSADFDELMGTVYESASASE
jgi:hypothetical protein